MNIPFPESAHGRVTISAGLARGHTDCVNADQLVTEADRHLYAAKRAGRNRLISEPV
ncbi:diguanylate cyclase domain-containing protein [Pseudohongiella sp. O18]|uniref:diguanylate cyclase domain-containing protein n=1 Tax=Pseudohongiella sp. O18 TaxID=2904248 RepID=UPI00398391F4